MRYVPSPKEVRALRLDVVRQAKAAVREQCDCFYRMTWWGPRLDVCGAWVPPEVRTIRRLILDDLRRLEYELKRGIGKRMPKKKGKAR